jgi:hypothetical protein
MLSECACRSSRSLKLLLLLHLLASRAVIGFLLYLLIGCDWHPAWPGMSWSDLVDNNCFLIYGAC